jgi:hypothetical protein
MAAFLSSLLFFSSFSAYCFLQQQQLSLLSLVEVYRWPPAHGNCFSNALSLLVLLSSFLLLRLLVAFFFRFLR